MVETRSIRADYAAMSCDVCGRTLLRGEHADAFLAGGVRRQVCELCIPRAQHEGWIREAGMDEMGAGGARHEGRGRSWLDRIRAHRERARDLGAEEPVPAQEEPAAPRVRRREAGSEPAARPAESHGAPRHVRAVPTNAELKMQRAIDLFNVSEFPRTVAGVARSLGTPEVCVRPLVERPSVVTITVMWELSWYRFEVDLSDEAGGLRREASGYELDELDPGERVANAAADEHGALAPARAA